MFSPLLPGSVIEKIPPKLCRQYGSILKIKYAIMQICADGYGEIFIYAWTFIDFEEW
jgi:hypothetical protein